MARYLPIVGVVFVACGGATTSTRGPVANDGSAAPPASRDDVIRRAMTAMAAGDVDRLVALADLDGLFDRALSCTDASPGDSRRKFESRLRDGFAASVKAIRGGALELTSIDNDVDVGGVMWGNTTSAHNADLVAADGRVSSKCTARTDLTLHEARIHVRSTHEGESRDRTLSVHLLAERGRWHLIRMPNRLEARNMADVLEDYAQQMCACRDKACADDVQERLTKWGTEMARHSDPTERPDPEVAKRTTEIMSRYVDCMTKLMMNTPGGTP